MGEWGGTRFIGFGLGLWRIRQLFGNFSGIAGHPPLPMSLILSAFTET